MPGFQGITTAGAADELLTGSRFYFEAAGKVQERAILEITGLKVECPPANSNAVLGSMVGGQSMRQATPTRQKFNVLSVKLILKYNDTELFEWYTACNNESANQAWQDGRTDVTIRVYNQSGEDAGEWRALNAYPVSYAGPDFQSGDETMANESVDIVYEDLEKAF